MKTLKPIRTILASALCLLALCLPSLAATATLMLRVSPGPSYTGLASSVLVTVYDNTHTALATNSNTPDGVHSFAEEGSGTGSYWALYNVDTTKLPLSYTTTISGTSLVFPPVVIGQDRAIQIADGYTASLPGTLTTGQAGIQAAVTAVSTGVAALPSASSIATAILAANVGGTAGTLTMRQASALSVAAAAGSYLAGTLNTGTHLQTVTYYLPGTTLSAINAGTATVIGTAVVTYAPNNTTQVSRIYTPGTF